MWRSFKELDISTATKIIVKCDTYVVGMSYIPPPAAHTPLLIIV